LLLYLGIVGFFGWQMMGKGMGGGGAGKRVQPGYDPLSLLSRSLPLSPSLAPSVSPSFSLSLSLLGGRGAGKRVQPGYEPLSLLMAS